MFDNNNDNNMTTVNTNYVDNIIKAWRTSGEAEAWRTTCGEEA